jgi:UDP-N-acetylglucosamine--N-acetylmuramyl-(pentapeptide) pyrophosphoryl-undecaprenol N-acetylglucosamine transferase
MNKSPHTKVCITGGHITPALALIDEIARVHQSWNMVFIGRSQSTERGDRSQEPELVKQKGVTFLPITAGRMTRQFDIPSLWSWLKIPVGYVQAFAYCLSERPDIVVSFGGYIALPVVVAARFLGIPVVTHEQTRVPGLANRIIGKLAKKVCVTFADTAGYFPRGKTVVTGLPIRQELLHPVKKAPFDIVLGDLPLVYITGGTTGAVSINERVFPIIGQLVKKCIVIHQTGSISEKHAREYKQQLHASDRDRYVVQANIDASAVAWILQHASLVVGRSGANTVVELAVLGTHALCIPLPWSAGGEQLANAKWLSSLGLAEVIEQHNATSDMLLARISAGIQVPRKKSPATGIFVDGAARMLGEIDAILG